MRRKEPPSPQTLLAGRNPVREALEQGRAIDKVLLQNGIDRRVAGEIRSLARDADIPVQSVPLQRLERAVPGVNHQGVVALLATVRYAGFDDMLRDAAPDRDTVTREKPLIVALDGVQDPHNLGAIIRSAVAAGANGVVLPLRGSAPLNTAALKASAGTALQIPVARVTSLPEALMQLKERGYWVAGVDGTGEQSVWDMDWNRPLALIVGSEASGLDPKVSRTCDYLVRIPMRGPVDSLNASVAAGVLLFAATRDR